MSIGSIGSIAGVGPPAFAGKLAIDYETGTGTENADGRLEKFLMKNFPRVKPKLR